MAENKNFEKLFQKDINTLEYKINHPRISNLKIYASKGAVLSGMVMTKIIPFIAASIIYSSAFPELVTATEKEIPMNSKVIVTSTGIEKTTSSFDYEYNDESLKYSTGWTTNEDGLFKRTITTYKIKDLDRGKTSDLFRVSKEELEEKYLISSTKIIEKKELSDNDAIYKEDMIIATFADKDWSKTKIEKESLGAHFFDFVLYLALSLSTGFGLIKISNKLVKPSIYERLQTVNSKLKLFKDYDLEKYKVILQLKRENLFLFQSDNLENEEKTIKKIRARGR